MKRRLLWLLLPLLLLGIMLGVKWRLDHPTPTPNDLKVRAILTKFSQVDVDLGEPLLSEYEPVPVPLAAQEQKALTDSLCLLPQPLDANANLFPAGSFRATIQIFYTMPAKRTKLYPHQNLSLYSNVSVILDIDGSRGEIFLGSYAPGGNRHYQLHPATVRQWIRVLFADPQLNPGLRGRGLS